MTAADAWTNEPRATKGACLPIAYTRAQRSGKEDSLDELKDTQLEPKWLRRDRLII